MIKFDFHPYKLELAEFYDGFIDPNGHYYRVKVKGEDNNYHDLWAEQYIRHASTVDLSIDLSSFSKLREINNFTDYLVNVLGFAYYNHGSIFMQPIIKLPNPDIAQKKATSDQIETLFQIMTINNEHPLSTNFLIDARMFYYNGLEDGGCIKK